MTTLLYRVRGLLGPTFLLTDGQRRISWPDSLESLHEAYASGQDVWEIGQSAERLDIATAMAPVMPSKIVCIGLNYAHHAQEMNKPVPEEPLMFLKPSTALIGPGQIIKLPPQSLEVHHEAELAIVIGRRANKVSEDEAMDHVIGFCCANDVTARDIQRRENRYTRAKGFDTFCPLGPAIALRPDFDPLQHRIKCLVNGQVRQDSAIDDLIFSMPYLVHFVSQVMTLLPGDVILTGTPMGVGVLRGGDEVIVEIDGLGQLKNMVEA